MRIEGVLVVGGGYAGLHAARAAADADVATTVVDPTGQHSHITRLAAVAGGTTAVARASTPLADFGHDVLVGAVVAVGDGTVELVDGRTVEADAVIVSAGARPTRPPVDGIEHALTLRDADDALLLRRRIENSDRLLVVGGGATGVQLAGAAAAAHPDLSVTLVEAMDRLLTPMSTSTGRGAMRILRQRGVDIRLGTEIQEITADGAVIDDELVEATVVWAGGFEARADGLGLDVSGDGRILVDDRLRVMGMERTFAAGDVAAHLGCDGKFLAMSAQIAVQAGTAAGHNAVRTIRAEPLTAPHLVQRGWVLELGGHRGLAEFGPLHLSGAFADLIPPFLHDAIDVKTTVGERGVSALPGAVIDVALS